MLPSNFQPSGTFDLIRIGSENDGGYLIEKQSITEAKALVSFGIHDDWLFEKQFLGINKIPLQAFDHTLNSKLLIRNTFLSFGECFFDFRKFSQKLGNFFRTTYALLDYRLFFRGDNVHHAVMVGYDGPNSRSLSNILSDDDLQFPVFIKCDIEGWEYRILDEFVEQADKICGLTIEFHDIDLHLERIERFIEDFSLELVHIHPNNYGGYDDKNNPIVIEMTFAKSPKLMSSTSVLPHPKDTPNNIDDADIVLQFD